MFDVCVPDGLLCGVRVFQFTVLKTSLRTVNEKLYLRGVGIYDIIHKYVNLSHYDARARYIYRYRIYYYHIICTVYII